MLLTKVIVESFRLQPHLCIRELPDSAQREHDLSRNIKSKSVDISFDTWRGFSGWKSQSRKTRIDAKNSERSISFSILFKVLNHVSSSFLPSIGPGLRLSIPKTISSIEILPSAFLRLKQHRIEISEVYELKGCASNKNTDQKRKMPQSHLSGTHHLESDETIPFFNRSNVIDEFLHGHSSLDNETNYR